MKKALNFLKKGTFVTAMFLFITGSLVLSGVDLENESTDNCSTYVADVPRPDPRPIGSGGLEQN